MEDGTTFDLDSVERRLVWIIGSPRTGSTWLLRLLLHPWGVGKTRSGIERSRWRPAGPDVVPINESYLGHHLGPRRELSPGSLAEGATPYINEMRRRDPAYFFSDSFAAEWKPRLRELVLSRFDAQASLAAAEHGLTDPLIVIKEPNGSHAAELLVDLLPESRLVFLLRDGRDVIDSMLDADSEGGWRTRVEGVEPVRTDAQRMATVRREANLWLTRTLATERACAMLGPDRWTRVRYEDLLADTSGELRRLDTWLGIDRDDRARKRAAHAQRFGSLRNRLRGRRKGIRAASPGLWRENLSAAEQRAAEEIIGPTLRRLGYRA
jgi:hypothetical protein